MNNKIYRLNKIESYSLVGLDIRKKNKKNKNIMYYLWNLKCFQKLLLRVIKKNKKVK